MDLFSGKRPKKLRYPIATARLVSLVRAVETSDDGTKHWSPEEAREVTRELMRETEPGTKPASFIEKRAALAFSRMTKKAPSLLTMKLNYGAKTLTALCLVVGSYLVGAFSARLLSNGAEINLLSPLFIAPFVWSLFVYAALVLIGAVSIVRRRHLEFPFRTSLAKLSYGLFAPKLITSGLRRSFLAIWTPAVLRLAQFHIAKTLHWSFLAFTAGIITCVIVQGFGNTYLVGWSCDALENAPDSVERLFNCLWGWIPAAFNLGPLPDSNTIAAMRLDRLVQNEAAATLSPASVWFPRLFLLYAALILVPRLLLILWDTFAIRISAGRVPLEFDEYFERILSEAESSAAPKPEVASGQQPEAPREQPQEAAEEKKEEKKEAAD